jgi:hypothetical protein
MTSVDLLRRQHGELRALLQRVRDSDGRDLEIERDAFGEAVRMHWRVEEAHLHPLLVRFEYPELHRTIALHRGLRQAVRDHAPVEVLAARLEQHIADEQSGVLPFVAERVPLEVSEAAAYAMRETIAEIENENWIGTAHAWTAVLH